MKRTLPHWANLVLSGIAASTALGCSDPATQERAADSDVSVDTTVRHQTLEGFGASVAWYQQSLTDHERKDELYGLLFGDMGLDILRFRNRYQRTNEDSDVSPERELVERATESLGRRPKVLLTSWSPPASLKANDDDDCSSGDNCTLKLVDGAFPYDQFADYWADSLAFYAEQGIPVDYASIQNEPDFPPTGWEGCRFEPAETADLPGYDQALAAVSSRLAEVPEAPKLVGPETLGIHRQRVEAYMAELDQSLLGGVAHHLYEKSGDTWDWDDPGPDSYIFPMRGVASVARGLPVFQTEFATDEDNHVRGGFETAWLIQNSVLEGGASAFLYWDLIWPRRGLVALNWEDPTAYVVRDQYYAVRHFARFTDPGFVRVETTSAIPWVIVSAFVAPDDEQLTVVALNVGSAREFVKFDLGAFADAPQRVIRSEFDPRPPSTENATLTDVEEGLSTETWVELEQTKVEEGLSLRPQSVVTIVAG